jgi:hypothetical protein
MMGKQIADVQPIAGVDFFMPHPNLGDEINHNICQSEIEGGVPLDDLPVGARLELQTRHHRYIIENRGNHEVLISGHPQYCPEPVLVHLYGSNWGKSLIKLHYIGRGMRLEFRHPQLGVIRTSPIQEVRELIV